MEHRQKELSVANVAGWGSALVTFGLVQGALYLKARWGEFGLDPFQFVAVSEVALAGLASIGPVLFFMSLAALFASRIGDNLTDSTPQPKWKRWLAAFVFGIGPLAFIWWSGAWTVLMAIILSLVTLVAVVLSPIVPKAAKESPWLACIVAFCVYVSTTSGLLGSEDAKRIVEGSGKHVSVVSTERESFSGLHLIGRLGDTYAFWDTARKTSILLPVADVTKVEIARKGAVQNLPAHSPQAAQSTVE